MIDARGPKHRPLRIGGKAALNGPRGMGPVARVSSGLYDVEVGDTGLEEKSAGAAKVTPLLHIHSYMSFSEIFYIFQINILCERVGGWGGIRTRDTAHHRILP